VSKTATRQAPEPEALEEIKSVVRRARQGDASVLPRLRVLLDEHPTLWRRSGDLAVQAEMAWATLTAGPDLHLRESLLRRAEALRQELAGPTPSPVERMLVGRAVACWLQLHYFDALEAQALNNDERPRLAAFRARRQEQAHRMYLTSLAALTTLRKLLPTAPVKALPAPQTETTTRPERNGQSRTAQAPGFPLGAHDRLSGFFDEPAPDPRSTRPKRRMAKVGTRR
jgi:hypothetical protein